MKSYKVTFKGSNGQRETVLAFRFVPNKADCKIKIEATLCCYVAKILSIEEI